MFEELLLRAVRHDTTPHRIAPHRLSSRAIMYIQLAEQERGKMKDGRHLQTRRSLEHETTCLIAPPLPPPAHQHDPPSRRHDVTPLSADVTRSCDARRNDVTFAERKEVKRMRRQARDWLT